MNTDIRISTSFLNHRKRKKLRHILGPGSTGYLIDLWINTAVNRPKGILYDMDKADIALDAGWEGKAGQFVDTLLEVGFLDYDGEWFRLHDWDQHQSWAINAEERSKQARNAANTRWGGNNTGSNGVGQCDQDTGSMPPAQGQDANGNTPILSSPTLTTPNQEESTADAESETRLPTKDELENGSPQFTKKAVKDMAEKIYKEKLFPKVHAFKNKMIKDGMNDSAILHVLSRCYIKGTTSGFNESNPWAYCQKIIAVENGNYNEQDYNKTS